MVMPVLPRVVDYRIDVVQMVPGCYFGHYTAEHLMNLIWEAITLESASRFQDHCRRGFITAGFYS
jgi:hypothetical protein